MLQVRRVSLDRMVRGENGVLLAKPAAPDLEATQARREDPDRAEKRGTRDATGRLVLR